ncbi:hypothetical protein HPB51_003863 [Rhipicephalus microplus]|uniref:Sugar transporter SWEET1 n=1 Tax=Rhipicephalus microplus TaxID=6941 RepID=A0A9J6D3B4_RHIMP|nr:bidirectional sugar transporter SWEET8-like [Rhipicephalus microplus]XP_037289277.1 bidirectional sugar transporter SWEET8-like [Rhipicephalus microplus]KAH7987094.1 hypothetical protein HPB51_026558 [Rhipicephalus microplus]KAH8035022.1 hypothetical protein HPB51_003863 [Rhipicephalus microplus]
MGTAVDLVSGMADVVTILTLFVSLSMAWRVWRARSSSGVEFLPVAATAVCLHAYVLYGIATCDSHITWVNSLGFALMVFNSAVHRTFSTRTGPGVALALILVVVRVASLPLSASQLGTIGVVCAALDNLTPVCRIVKKKPLPEVASATLLTCSLWETYGVLVGSGSLMASNGIGASVALVELAAALWVRCRRTVYVAIETTS